MSPLPPGPFARLAELLGDAKPGKAPINLSIGDPSGTVPPFITEALTKASRKLRKLSRHHRHGGMARRPPPAGSTGASDLNGAIDPEKHVLPLNGTREGLFSVLFPLLPRDQSRRQSRSSACPILSIRPMPPPRWARAPSRFMCPATEASGFLPDYASLPEEVLARLAAVYICSPSNPEGAAASEDYWRQLFALAERHDFIVLADECYADIYFDQPPVCALARAVEAVRRFQPAAHLPFSVQAFRPAGPALRHGGGRCRADRAHSRLPQCGGTADARTDPGRFGRRLAGRSPCRRQPRRLCRRRWRRPSACWETAPASADRQAAFSSGWRPAMARRRHSRLWREQGVKVLPGAYMGREIEPGKTQSNPGFSYIRVALVSDLSTIMTALERVNDFLRP